MSALRLDLAHCEALVARACAGDDEACRDLTKHLWPHWERIVRGNAAMGSLATSRDHVHDVLVQLAEKISPEGGTALGLYPAWRRANDGKNFEDWMCIVVGYTVRDYVRQTLGRSRARDPGVPSPKRLLNEFVTSAVFDEAAHGARPPMTLAQTAREMLDWAQSRLPDLQLRALLMWLEGAEFDEIGADLAGGDAEGARKLLRAAVAVLRRHFGGAPA